MRITKIYIMALAIFLFLCANTLAWAGTWEEVGTGTDISMAPNGDIWKVKQNYYNCDFHRWTGTSWEYKGKISERYYKEMAWSLTGKPYVLGRNGRVWYYNSGTSWSYIGSPDYDRTWSVITIDHDGNIWIAREYHSSYRYKDGNWQYMGSVGYNGGGAANPRDLVNDPTIHGKLWCHTGYNDVTWWDGSTWVNDNQYPQSGGLLDCGWHDLIFDRNRTLYAIQTYSDSPNYWTDLWRYNGGTSWTKFRLYHEYRQWLTTITEAPDGNLYLGGGSTRIGRFDGSSLTHFNQIDSSATQDIRNIITDRKGQMWAAANGKIYRYSPKLMINAVSATQTTVNFSLNWDGRGIKPMTLQVSQDGVNYSYVKTVSGTSATATNLQPGTNYYFRLVSDQFYTGKTYIKYESEPAIIRTIPATPSAPNGTISTKEWSSTAGRGKVVLNWPSYQGATGYKVWVFDGNTYRAFDVGNSTSWDSSVAKIYPSESWLDSQAGNSVSSDPFSHVQGGYDLRDDPNKLYLKTTRTTYDSKHNYWFRVSAYNESGETPRGSAYMPTLPNRTDKTAPNVSITLNSGSAYTNSSTVTINLSANDPLVSNYTSTTSDDASGIYQMRFSNDGASWSSWETYNSAKSWTLVSGDGTKTVYCQVKDNAGNISGTSSDSIYVDTTPPSGSVNINGGATYTTSRTINLSLSATDSGSGIYQMQFRDNSSSWSSWYNYATSHGYTLTTGDGTRTVFVRYKDKAGNISGEFSDTIILDTATPTGSITINSGNAYTNNRSVSLSFTGNDVTSGVSQMIVANSSDFAGVSWEPFDVNKSWTITSGDGSKTVYMKLKDNAGNISVIYSDSITLDTVNPSGTIEVTTEDGLSKTADTSVVLTITGSDDRSGLVGMHLSNDAVSWTTLEPVTSPKDWTLTSGAGTKIVYLKLIDNAGNEYVTSGDIYLTDDVIGPTVQLAINNNDTGTTSSLVDLSIIAYDNFSKASAMQMRFSNDGTHWSSWEPFSESKIDWDITNASYGGVTSQGDKKVYVQVLDDADNVGQAVDTIGYSTSPPTGTTSSITGVEGAYDGKTVRFVKSGIATLDLSYSNASKMRFSLDGGISWGEWESYDPNKEITLPKGDGLTTVCIQTMDVYGAVSDIEKRYFVLDAIAPEIKELSTVSGATATSSSTINVRLIATDNLSSQLQYSVNGSIKSVIPADNIISCPVGANLLNTITVTVYDTAENSTTSTLKIWKLN